MMNPLSVLLIEDNPADADLTREAFESNRQDVDLSVVLDGVDALDFLHQREGFSDATEPDLVLLDLNLPRKSGREVLAEIKRSDRLRQIPVVVLSSSRDGEDVRQSYDLGANSYISKPVDFHSFRIALSSLKRFWFSTVQLPSGKKRRLPFDGTGDAD